MATLTSHVEAAAAKVAGLFVYLDLLCYYTACPYVGHDKMTRKARNPKRAPPLGQIMLRQNYARDTRPCKINGFELGKPQAW